MKTYDIFQLTGQGATEGRRFHIERSLTVLSITSCGLQSEPSSEHRQQLSCLERCGQHGCSQHGSVCDPKQRLSLFVHSRTIQQTLQLIRLTAAVEERVCVRSVRQHLESECGLLQESHILFFLGVPCRLCSAVGTSCSPGRTQSIGPSSL